MKPRKLRVYEAIPPPPGYIIPLALRPKQRLTSTEIAKAQADFEKRASEDYYAEWFWFPYSDYVWVNTWETTNDPTGVEDYPNSFDKVLQLAGTLLTQVLQNTAALTRTQQIFPLTRTTLLCNYFPNPFWLSLRKLISSIAKAAMLNLPPYEIPLGLGNSYETIRTWVPDALHFQ
ncbi:hypothetical protein MMC14_003435 [Varicellaria rhodocarpa]|nr:hypothetical protein [Varicellaria rhodocarpa]